MLTGFAADRLCHQSVVATFRPHQKILLLLGTTVPEILFIVWRSTWRTTILYLKVVQVKRDINRRVSGRTTTGVFSPGAKGCNCLQSRAEGTASLVHTTCGGDDDNDDAFLTSSRRYQLRASATSNSLKCESIESQLPRQARGIAGTH